MHGHCVLCVTQNLLCCNLFLILMANTVLIYASETWVWRQLWTLFLFTKSDIKTTLIPISVFASVAAPVHSWIHFLQSFFWIWLHLLQFDVSNQTLDPEEDNHNKRDRPLPSGRITLYHAKLLRWFLVPACFLYSWTFSAQVLNSSIALVFFTVLYDELGAHAGHWAVRNAVNACGFCAFEFGSSLVAGADNTQLDSVGLLAVALSVGIFATTIHSQDFKDQDGDRQIGRQTIPLVMPHIARHTILIAMIAWSCFLSRVWNLDLPLITVFCSLGLFVGWRYMVHSCRWEDQVSFYWYNVWLSMAHALPGIWRLKRHWDTHSNSGVLEK